MFCASTAKTDQHCGLSFQNTSYSLLKISEKSRQTWELDDFDHWNIERVIGTSRNTRD